MLMSKRLPLTLIALGASLCLAQTTTMHVSVQSGTQGRPVRSRTGELQEIVANLEQSKLRPAVPSSWEDQVLTAATRSAGQTLRMSLGDPNGASIYTLPTSPGDTLVAHWNGADSSRAERAIWLWDTPFYTTFVLELAPSILQPDELTRYSEGLLRWDISLFKSLKLVYFEPEGDVQWVGGLVEYPQTEQGSWNVWFAAIGRKDKAYVAISMSKSLFSDKYPTEAYEVRERFPPLRLRLAGASRQALFDEIGKDYVGGSLTTYPTNRDWIVLSELLSRGPLSDGELRRVIVGSFDKGDYQSANVVNIRSIVFLQVAKTRKELAAYAPALEGLILGVKIHAAAAFVIAGMFGTMEQQHVDFSHAALALVERGQFTHEGLRYLERNASDEETLQKLSGLTVRPEMEQEKNEVVRGIRDRLGRGTHPR